jgi:hypothetical protein
MAFHGNGDGMSDLPEASEPIPGNTQMALDEGYILDIEELRLLCKSKIEEQNISLHYRSTALAKMDEMLLAIKLGLEEKANA